MRKREGYNGRVEEPKRVINEDDCRQVKKDEECTRRSKQVNNVGCRLAIFLLVDENIDVFCEGKKMQLDAAARF